MPLADNKAIVVIGSVNRDIKARFTDEVTTLADSQIGTISSHDGGVGRNITEALARLGMNPIFITVFGDDEDSKKMMQSLHEKDVDLSHAIIAGNTSSDLFISIHDDEGEFVTGVNQMTLINAITPTYIQTKADLIQSADFVICDCNLPAETIEKIMQLTRDNTLIIDAVSVSKAVKIKPHLDKIDILKVNLTEAAILSDCDTTSSLSRIATTLGKAGVRHPIISDGAKGFSITIGDDHHHFEAHAAAPKTVTGAGDCLLAGYVFGIANGYSILQSCELARQAAYLSTKTVAATNDHITKESILAILET